MEVSYLPSMYSISPTLDTILWWKIYIFYHVTNLQHLIFTIVYKPEYELSLETTIQLSVTLYRLGYILFCWDYHIKHGSELPTLYVLYISNIGYHIVMKLPCYKSPTSDILLGWDYLLCYRFPILDIILWWIGEIIMDLQHWISYCDELVRLV